MAVSLFSTGAASRKSAEDHPDATAHREAVQRAKNVESARAAIGAITVQTGRSSLSGVHTDHVIAGFYGERPRPSAQATKAEPKTLHQRAQKHAAGLSPNAVQLFDLMVRADDLHKGAQLVAAPVSDIARALAIKSDEAEAARTELERRDLIYFVDHGTGDRGFRVRP